MPVRLNAVCLSTIPPERVEERLLRFASKINGDYPFQPVTAGAPKEQHRLEVFVLQQPVPEFLAPGHVVKVQANQSAVPDEPVFSALLERAGESGIIEVTSLERLALLRVLDSPQLSGGLRRIAADDVVPGIQNSPLRLRLQVLDRTAEVREEGITNSHRSALLPACLPDALRARPDGF